MKEGPVKIILSYSEPKGTEVIWMKPCLCKEGYEFLYFGANGWTPLNNPAPQKICTPITINKEQ